ncbi:hypothetical protein ACS2CL_28490, partial [Bacillus cereus group sp. BceL296]
MDNTTGLIILILIILLQLKERELKVQRMWIAPHAHQLKNFHYPQVTKNVILSKKLARKGDIFYESFDS